MKLKKILSYFCLLFIGLNIFNYTNVFVNANLSSNLEKEKINSLENKREKIKNYAEDRIIVKFKNKGSKPTISSIQSKLSLNKLKNLDYLDKINLWVLSFDKKIDNIDKVITDLKKSSNVEYVEKDYIRSISYTWVTTNDPKSIEQWYLKSINSDDAWKLYNDIEDKTIVSVNDTWINYNHPDLQGNLKNLSSSCLSDTWAVISWWCPNYGWNFEWNWNYDSSTALFPENEATDIYWHWTHVAWTIWAVWNNWTWVIWVTQNVEIISTRLDTYNTQYWVFYISNAIRWINFAIKNGAKIINASYGWNTFSQAEYDAINVAKNNWVLIIAAAWNSSINNEITHFYPSDYDLDNIISVASIWPNDTLASYSNYWTASVDLVAPWWEIIDANTWEWWILSTYIYEENVFENGLNSFSWVTISWTWADWYLYSSNPKNFIKTLKMA